MKLTTFGRIRSRKCYSIKFLLMMKQKNFTFLNVSDMATGVAGVSARTDDAVLKVEERIFIEIEKMAGKIDDLIEAASDAAAQWNRFCVSKR